MSSLREGGLVTVTEGEGRTLDGIVFQIAGPHKLVVAVPDPARGAVLRTFPDAAVTEREEPRPGGPGRPGTGGGGAGGGRPGPRAADPPHARHAARRPARRRCRRPRAGGLRA